MLRRLTACLALVTLAGCGGDDLVLPTEGARERLVALRGDQQVGRPGARLPDVLVIRLEGRDGQGIGDRLVVWTVGAGGGTVSPATGRTDPEGYASAQWTLGSSTGQQTAVAEVPGVGEVTFTARGGNQPDAARSTVVATPRSIRPGASSTISVTVRDEDGDPVEGATVSLALSGTGASLTQPTAATGPDGVTTGTVQGAATGEVEVRATVDGSVELDEAAVVVVTSEPGSPSAVSRLVFLVEPRDVRTNEKFPVEVALVDASGDLVPLSGIFIYVDLFPEGSPVPTNKRVRGGRFDNTDDGVAAFELAVERKGRYRLRALTDDLPELGPHGPEPYLFSDYFEVD